MKTLNATLLFSILNCSFIGFGGQKYVSVTGSDSQNGDLGTPWRTIQYGIDQLSSGDTLNISAGIYNEKIVFSHGGTSSAYLNIFGQSGAVLDGTGLLQNALVAIVDLSYIRIRGLELRNNIQNDAQGILVQGNCKGIELIENKLHGIHFSSNPADIADEFHNAQGIIVLGTDAVNPVSNLLIYKNELYDCRLGYSEGIAVNGNVDGFRISANLVHDLTNIGIVAIGHEQTSPDPATDQARNGTIDKNVVYNCHSSYAYCAGIYVDGAKSVVINGNFCHSNDYGIEVGCEHPGKTASEIAVKNNLLVNNHSCGFSFGGYDYPTNSGSVIDSYFSSNTLSHNDSLGEGSGEIVMNFTENCAVRNNIIYAAGQGIALSFPFESTDLSLDYNLYYTEGDTTALFTTNVDDYTLGEFRATGPESHAIFADPLFGTDLLDVNSYRSHPSSPGRDCGDPLYPMSASELDYFGIPRWITILDRGASEYPDPMSVSALKKIDQSVYPNPATSTLHIPAGSYQLLSGDGSESKTMISTGDLDITDLAPGVYYLKREELIIKFIKL